jgi:hypothetical protein
MSEQLLYCHCGKVFSIMAIGSGSGRDVRITRQGKEHSKCPTCGADLKTYWWQQQLDTWKQACGQGEVVHA